MHIYCWCQTNYTAAVQLLDVVSNIYQAVVSISVDFNVAKHVSICFFVLFCFFFFVLNNIN